MNTVKNTALLILDVFLISLAVIAAIYLAQFIILKPLLKDSIMPE